ncbi:MAG: YybH family protein [Candidatus Binatia bacterium]
MKRTLLVVAVLWMAGLAAAQAPKAYPGAGGPRTDLANDAAIRALYAEFVTAWNAHDAAKLASFWTIDGDVREPDGAVAKGRDEVAKHFADEHAAAFKDTEIKLTIDSVWFASGDVALVDGAYVVLNAVDPNGQALPPRKGLLTSVLIKEDGTWRVAASRSMIPIPLPWRPKP